MLESEIIELVSQLQKNKSKSNYVEVKSAKAGCPKIFDTLSSFSNQHGGGKILFGIDESSGYEICGVYDAATLGNHEFDYSMTELMVRADELNCGYMRKSL